MGIYHENYAGDKPKTMPKYYNWRRSVSEKSYNDWCKKIDDLYAFKRLGK